MKTIHIKLIILSFVLFINIQNIWSKTIEGWVYDHMSQKTPLIGVNIYWLGTTNGTITNANGYFNLPQTENNKILIFSYVGYQTDSINVSNQKQLTIHLRSGSDLNEVTIKERVQSSGISKLNPILTQNITSKELTKFACCNLSESFETNTSVDVAYADAVSGIKQIKMLGLSGRYSQLMLENIPILRGSETAFGLNYIPGTWMESIQVSKGTSAVKNGYESITGQINIIYQNPDNNEKTHLYFYGNQDGKVESNAGLSFKVNPKWNTNLLIHGASNSRQLDMNKDGFLDKPLSYTGNFMNRWNYKGEKVEAKLGISYLQETRTGGQTAFDHSKAQNEQSNYGIGIDVNRLNAFSKIGFLLKRSNTSIGWITSANYFTRESFYGNNTLDVDQINLYTNLMFQSFIGNTQHTYTTGLSVVYDDNKEWFNRDDLGFSELVPGTFFEYNYIPSEKFSLLVGLRSDYSNLHGLFVTPRAHVKYKLSEYSTARASIGKGYRTPITISENTQYLASSRTYVIEDKNIQEQAWNYGLSLSNEIPLGKRKASVTLEYFRTEFTDQLMVDLEQSSQEVHFYNLDGRSYANSIQIEAFYELFTQFELTGGLRFNEVKSDFKNDFKDVPFQSNYKGLFSAQYRTNLDKWQFDATIQFHGTQRLPDIDNNSNRRSKEYINLIAQVTKNYRYWSFYIGAENLGNYTQKNAIIAPEDPFGSSFDASQIWGPLYGRMFYIGIKYKLDKRF
ncbi:MAG: TonB-dependent receptor [Salinivirgaceae bacterium]|jgi:outer membrane receptor for ferrienterochelin and colicins|nr:TonB-dependent receptor [Salinivirgaceae bacterium]